MPNSTLSWSLGEIMKCLRTVSDSSTIECSFAIRPLMLIFLFVCLLGWPQGALPASGKKSASKNSAKENQSGQHKKAAAKVLATQPAVQENEEDDHDLPPMFLGRIDKQTYLKLREEYIARIRGIDLNNPPDPRIRMNAIRTMEEQEQRIYRVPGDSTAGTRGTISPFSPPSSTTWTELGPSPIPNGQTSPSGSGSGRRPGIPVHPSKPKLYLLGATQGWGF